MRHHPRRREGVARPLARSNWLAGTKSASASGVRAWGWEKAGWGTRDGVLPIRTSSLTTYLPRYTVYRKE
ncbi:hypothetical protein B0H10DRAFT_2239506 [Mycena sp. CBHHK59/15]|nr:hypothetical protein B0H10DRAFT_2239506 [Mycena sp. CBHHK59/15]